MKTKSLAKLPIHAPMFLALLLCSGITAFAQTPTLPANGKITFISDRDGNPEIYLMNAVGTNQIRLTNNLVVDAAPTWSPGRKIAFVSQKQDGSFAIFKMNAAGANRTELTAKNPPSVGGSLQNQERSDCTQHSNSRDLLIGELFENCDTKPGTMPS